MKIKILKNGPYQVDGGVPLNIIYIDKDPEHGIKWTKGEVLNPPKTYFLCRCGHTQNKPFCDGAHVSAEWKPDEVANRGSFEQNADVYIGPSLKLIDCVDLCAVARFCDFHHGVWKMARIAKPDSKEEEFAIQMSNNCPAGRLIIEKNGERIEPELEKEISIIIDRTLNKLGPIWVKGGIEIEGSDGEKYLARNRVTLCRCGESTNMPFCDASHMNCAHMELNKE